MCWLLALLPHLQANFYLQSISVHQWTHLSWAATTLTTFHFVHGWIPRSFAAQLNCELFYGMCSLIVVAKTGPMLTDDCSILIGVEAKWMGRIPPTSASCRAARFQTATLNLVTFVSQSVCLKAFLLLVLPSNGRRWLWEISGLYSTHAVSAWLSGSLNATIATSGSWTWRAQRILSPLLVLHCLLYSSARVDYYSSSVLWFQILNMI